VAAAGHDSKMIEAFRRGEDIHLSTAATVHGIPLNQVTPKQRQDAKAINFGIIYGITDEGLADGLDIELSDAHAMREDYLNTYHGVKDYMEARRRDYRERGYVETLFGRRVYIFGPDESHNERRAINTPIQGTASDINQKSSIEIDHIIESRNYRMGGVDVIHDAQVYEVPEDEIEEGRSMVKDTMEGLDLSFMRGVPLKVDIGIGKDLGSAKGEG